VQLVRRYREEPASLAAALPHRDPEELAQVARRLAFICWKDLGEKLCGSRPDDDAITAKVKSELRRRIA
jgi:hypothetical protein